MEHIQTYIKLIIVSKAVGWYKVVWYIVGRYIHNWVRLALELPSSSNQMLPLNAVLYRPHQSATVTVSCSKPRLQKRQFIKWVESPYDTINFLQRHDDVMTWKHFPHCWPFVRGIHWSVYYKSRVGSMSFIAVLYVILCHIGSCCNGTWMHTVANIIRLYHVSNMRHD